MEKFVVEVDTVRMTKDELEELYMLLFEFIEPFDGAVRITSFDETTKRSEAK